MHLKVVALGSMGEKFEVFIVQAENKDLSSSLDLKLICINKAGLKWVTFPSNQHNFYQQGHDLSQGMWLALNFKPMWRENSLMV